MSSKWDKMDRRVFENSEVMKEFEKILFKAIDDFEKVAKVVKAQSAIEQGAESAKKLHDAVVPANQATKELVTTLKQNLTEDDMPEDDESESEDIEISDEEYNEAKDCLMEELRLLSYDAADNKNIKLAYKIERTIYDLEELFDEDN